MKYIIVTTFPHFKYEEYGRRMIETFDAHWPEDVDIHIYNEGDIPKIGSSRVHYHDLHATIPRMVEFKERHKNDPVANGQPNSAAIPGGVRRPDNIKERHINSVNYLWDAVRFSHKVYPQVHAARTFNSDVMYWLDADTITFRDVGDAHKTWLPEGKFCAYLGRNTYTECGFIAFNTKHPHTQNFMSRYQMLYDTDEIFTLHQWTDCHAFDKIREDMEREHVIENHNLNTATTKGHPFVNSVLGQYMDHLKGARKIEGSSRRKDIIVDHGLDYWNNIKR